MTEKSFTGTTVLCPTCRSRTFFQDESWKYECVACYIKRKGKTTTPKSSINAGMEKMEPGMLRRLIQLCHPDKHGGSEASTTATRYLLELRAK